MDWRRSDPRPGPAKKKRKSPAKSTDTPATPVDWHEGYFLKAGEKPVYRARPRSPQGQFRDSHKETR